MRVVIVNTVDVQGGAAKAAYRLHCALRNAGHESSMLVRFKKVEDIDVLKIDSQQDPVDYELKGLNSIQEGYINANRTPLSNTLFSFPYPGYDISHVPIVQEADVINLHWVAAFQSPQVIRNLYALNKPIVWTLHDMWPLTGGCHYSAGCDRYQHTCHGCPQLAHDPYHIPAATLADKQALQSVQHLTFVTPSQWLAQCVRQSRLFRDHRVEVIPNCVELDRFHPKDSVIAKQALGLDEKTFTILIGAGNCNERRKGFAEFLASIRYCLEDEHFREMATGGQISIVCFGLPNEDLNSLPLPVLSLGNIRSEDKLSDVYSAADVFVLPSLEDNLPNTMLESMACGTPVLGFRTGGLPDLIDDETGWLVPLGDSKALGDVLLQVGRSPDKAHRLRSTCRQRIEANYGPSNQAQAYTHLFETLRSTSISVTQTTHSPTPDKEVSPESAYVAQPTVMASTEASLSFTRAALTLVSKEFEEFKQSNANSLQHQASSSQSLSKSSINTHTVDALKTKLQRKKETIQSLKGKLTQAEEKNDILQKEIDEMQASKFWKIKLFWTKLKSLSILSN
jgi:glycosyltransferase involved in cell wall biosynthesis